MKKRTIIPLLLLAGALAVVGCSMIPGQETMVDAAVPVVQDEEPNVILAEAVLEASTWRALRFETGGTVLELVVEEGDTVTAGELVATLDPTDAELGVRQATAALEAAQAQLALVKAGARSEEVDGARAALTVAQAQLGKVLEGASSSQLAAVKAELDSAEAALKQAQAAYDRVSWRADIGALPQSLALEQATNAYNAAKARYDDVANGPSQADIALAEAQVEQAKPALAQALAGPTAEQVDVADAAVQQAQVSLEIAQQALARTALRAPFDGTVTRVDAKVGDLVAPGQPVLVLSTLSPLQARTIDLNELDVVHVAVGQAAIVTVDALPDVEIPGHVTEIGLQAENYRGDTTYPVTVVLDDTLDGLRLGMSALVRFELE